MTACPGDGATTTESSTTDPSTTEPGSTGSTTGESMTGESTATVGEPTTGEPATTVEPGTTGEPATTGEPGTTSEPATTGEPGTTSEPATSDSTTTEPGPAVCGDGIVADTEVCDDGNDKSDDGCDATCSKTAAIEWTYTHDGGSSDSAQAVVIDHTGRIIVGGNSNLDGVDMLLIALAPDGTELWRKTYDGAFGLDDHLLSVAVDADDNIYVGGDEEMTYTSHRAIVRRFDPAGNETWTFTEAGPEDRASVSDVVVGPDAVYSVGYERLPDIAARLVVRRHDLATGNVAWKTPVQPTNETIGYAITLAGADIVAVGKANNHPVVAILDDTGGLVSTTVDATAG
ncbi:hypothetical protein OV203_25405, partial [Nannocystis sp. ILAH1]|nr:hypothetical protein [Nannocystis sp. ILAH1]